MLYGAPPGTETGKLSVPHQNPGGPSPSGRAWATVAARAVPVASMPAVTGISRSRAASGPRISHDRFMSPPRDRFTIVAHLYDGRARFPVGRGTGRLRPGS